MLILCVALYVGGALLGFDAYDTVCISAHWVVQRGQGTLLLHAAVRRRQQCSTSDWHRLAACNVFC